MNFFEHQAVARRNSTRMVALFVLAVVGIVVAVDVGVWLTLGAYLRAGGGSVTALLTASTLGVLAVIGLGSLYRIASLRGGGTTVAIEMGGTPVPEDTRDYYLRRLRNVVEEIAIASGVPVPGLFVLEYEAGINAFAAGYGPSDAVVAVTRGALEKLNRDELQGVIAHEFSHILNGDMRLSIRLMGVLFGIMVLSIIGRRLLGMVGHGRRRDGVLPIMVIALLALVVGSIGLFFGRLIKAGVSRQREMLADASAVQFTRQTAGLAGALKKIGGIGMPGEGSYLADTGAAEEVSHMLFGEGLRMSRWFATHPPLLEQIRTLEPSFDDSELVRLSVQWMRTPPDGHAEDVALGFAAPPALPGNESPSALPPLSRDLEVTPQAVAAQVAAPAQDDYLRAGSMVGALGEELRALAGRREMAMPLLLGLLLDEAGEIAALQRGQIVERMGEAVAQEAAQLRERSLHGLHPMLRLPLAALAFPTLRLRPRPELERFIATVQAVVRADGQVSLFEYCLGRLLVTQLRESLDPARHVGFGRRKPAQVQAEIGTLLAVVAQAGHRDRMNAQRAWLAGMHHLLPRAHVAYAPPATGVLALEAAWKPLDALDPLAKQLLVEAVTLTIGHDERVTVAEAELLRTICGVLHCPLPAMLERG